jgi:hypothetical protein
VKSGARGPGNQPREARCPDHRQPQVRKAHKEPLRLVHGTSGQDELAQPSPDTQVILFTEGGLELPLVASPEQIARLLESVSEMAAGIENDGLLLSPGTAGRGPRPVRTDQVLSRVRVIVQRGTSAEGQAS